MRKLSQNENDNKKKELTHYTPHSPNVLVPQQQQQLIPKECKNKQTKNNREMQKKTRTQNCAN